MAASDENSDGIPAGTLESVLNVREFPTPCQENHELPHAIP
jgi:hypothetical protein